MNTARLIVSFVIAIYGFAYIAACGLVSGISSYTGDSHRNQSILDMYVLLACVIPIIALWTPSLWLLVIGGLILTPLVIFGLLCMAAPPFGIALLFPPIIWYAAAYSRGKVLAHIIDSRLVIPNLKDDETRGPVKQKTPERLVRDRVSDPNDW